MVRILSFLLLSAFLAFAQTGQITVRVHDTSGAALPGAIVRVGARPFRNTLANFHSVQNAAADGSAVFNAVPQGAYEVCAQLPGSLLLDSCSWINHGAEIFLPTGAAKTIPVVLQTGTLVVVQVDDATHQFSKEAYPGHKLRLKVSAPNMPPIPMMAKPIGNSRQFSALVPADTDLRLHVRSSELQVADPKGASLNMKDPNQFVPLHSAPAVQGAAAARSASAAPVLTLQVVGIQ